VRLSIRWRLTFWNTLALTVVLTCFACLVYGLLRQALFEQTDRLLLTALGQLRDDPRAQEDPESRMGYWIKEYREHMGLLCVVYRLDSSAHARTPGLADESLPPAPVSSEGRVVSTGLFPGIGRHRLLAERMRLGRQEFVVVLLAPLEAVERELDHVRNVLLAAGPIALILSAGFGYWLARTALAPVDRLRRATEEITADRLDQRLPVLEPSDELGRLSRTINAMIARLEQSFEEIRRFTADASHELRTPLTVLRTEVEVSLGQALSAAEHRERLGAILEELGRMSRLTDQLLTLSRRDAGVEPFALVALDLCVLVAGVVDALRPLAEAKGVLLQLDAEGPACPIAGDEALLRQVFINLVDNALKFTPEGGRVTVRVSWSGQGGVVCVTDTGIGIAAEHLPHVFDRFYRVDRARSRAEGGTGLGLSIAQSIVKAHGGTIEMTSTPGKGSVCTVTLLRADLKPN
jgi:heavy metal sensor kinase